MSVDDFLQKMLNKKRGITPPPSAPQFPQPQQTSNHERNYTLVGGIAIGAGALHALSTYTDFDNFLGFGAAVLGALLVVATWK